MCMLYAGRRPDILPIGYVIGNIAAGTAPAVTGVVSTLRYRKRRTIAIDNDPGNSDIAHSGGMMDDNPERRSGIIAQIVSDPIRLLRWSRIALAGLLLLVIVSQLLAGIPGGMLTALTWICAPFVAFGIGVGDAFFVRHGQRRRRILLSILASAFTVLTACVILATISDSSPSRTQDFFVAGLYAVFQAGIVIGLAGLIALGIGRGEDYVSRGIDRMSREDW